MVNDAVMVPADVIKQRLQVSQGQYKGVLDCITQTWRHEGLTAFYRQERSWDVVDRRGFIFRMPLAGMGWRACSHINTHHVTDMTLDAHVPTTQRRSCHISSGREPFPIIRAPLCGDSGVQLLAGRIQ